MGIVIIDYGAGNIQSIQFALQRLGTKAILSNDPETIVKAERIIFPGVGEAASAMAKLKNTKLNHVIPKLKQPVLGICLGMQLMCDCTEEGSTKGLSIFNVSVHRFTDTLKVPHMGWNQIQELESPLFANLQPDYVYMVHSYYAPLTAESIATCNYGVAYSAALRKDNFYGVQFHPEKSGSYGKKILENFLNL